MFQNILKYQMIKQIHFLTNCVLTEENNLDKNFYKETIIISINDDLKKSIKKSKMFNYGRYSQYLLI